MNITIGESKMLWSSSVLELVEHKLCPLVESPDSGTGPTSGKLLRTTKTSPDLRVLSSVSFFYDMASGFESKEFHCVTTPYNSHCYFPAYLKDLKIAFVLYFNLMTNVLN